MSFDRMVENQNYYVRVQKTKLIVLVVLIVFAYFTGALDELLSFF